MDSVSEIRFGNNDIFATEALNGQICFYQILIHQNGIQTQIALDFKNVIDCQEHTFNLLENNICSFGFFGFSQEVKIMVTQIEHNENESYLHIQTVVEQNKNKRMFAYADVDCKIKWFLWDKIRGILNKTVSRNIFEVEDSKLGNRSQISILSIAHNSKQMGYCSVYGRGIVMEMTDRFQAINRIVYKGHKREKKIQYFINSLQFHSSSFDWVSTSFSDKTIIFLDLKKKNKITTISFDVSIIAIQVSSDGYFLAYATGYDWRQDLDEIENIFTNNVVAIFIQKQQLFYV